MSDLITELSKRRKIVRAQMGIVISDPESGDVLLHVGIEIVTYHTEYQMVTFNAEGIYGTVFCSDGLSGNELYGLVKDRVTALYLQDCFRADLS